MLYESAKYELKSPPASISLTAIATEAGTLLLASGLLFWLI